jgi:trimeric autotransporter adhesin
MRRLVLAALGAAVLLLSGCGGGMTTAPASGIKLSTNAFPNQIPSPCPLPGATADTAYSVSITASGGIEPFQWALAAGSSLPAGLALASGTPSATISGTPQESGTFTFTLQVTDAEKPPVTAAADFTLTVNSPVPAISSLSPSSATAGGAAFTLTVNGSSFVSGATVDWNGSARTTTFVSSTQLTAAIPATDIAAAGTDQVTVVNPAPGGGASNALTFTVNNPVPAISSLSPSSAIANGPAFTLTVDGSNFVSGATVDWNGSARTTTFVSSTQLTAAIPASDITTAAIVNVTVVNPTPGGGPSNAAAFTVRSFPQIVSVATDGTQGNNFSGTEGRVATSADGRFVAFQSDASNLVAGDTNQTTDVFLRDTCQTIAGPVAGCTPSTTLVSATPSGAAGNGLSDLPSISADGRFVVFDSQASDLVETDNNETPDVFLRDTCQTSAGPVAACTPSTSLVSVATDGTQGNGLSAEPSISADGRYVAFDSYANTLVANDSNQLEDVFVRDTCQTSAGPVAGCAPSTIRVSVATDGSQANAYSALPSISADGRFVAFESLAGNLGAPPSDFQQVYVRDTCAGGGANCAPSTTLVSADNSGTEGFGDSELPSISADGRFIAFGSYANNLVAGDTNGAEDVFVRDTCVGAGANCAPSTIRVSVATDGTQGNSEASSGAPSISADGRFVAFDSFATILVAGDTNQAQDVFVHDTCAGVSSGCSPSTVRVSVASDGTQSDGGSYTPAISGDGHFVAFTSSATNLVTGDTNAFDDIFLTITGF